MTLQATLLAGALALAPAFARADDAKKSDTTRATQTSGDIRTNPTTNDQPGARMPETPSASTSASHRDMDHGEKLTDDQVLRKLHHTNQAEIKAGQLAQEKGTSRDVKSYGATLVRDHQKADQDVTTLARKMNVDLEAKKMDSEHQAKRQVHENKMEQLQKMSGKDFDRGFAQMMVNGHRQAIEMVKDARNTAKPELKSFLDRVLPTLQQHEDMANDILNKTRDTASAK